ncbi:hypothetical protein BG005_001242 [Podila minutissima]|nr:hypothetical protein BG005_001242 [Podila minutissima]
MDNCVVQHSIIANNAVLEEGVTVRKGCLISFNVTVGAKTTVPPFSRLTTLPEDEDDDELGRVFKEAEDSDDEDEEEDPKNKAVNRLAYDLKELALEGQDDSASEFESEASDDEEEAVNPAEELDREVSATLERAFKDGHSVDIAALELNTLRMASFSNFHEMRKRIIPGVLRNIDVTAKPGSGKTTKEILARWGPLIGRMIHDEDDQVDGLYILQRSCASPVVATAVFTPALRYFYDNDITEEDAILKWFYSEKSQQGSDMEKQLREKTQPMIDYLEQSESEEESDEEDEDSE